ncbi:NmrA domain-containing protein [Favolaschia claudopus]|uniref:NmrA domain-containing protein n=1 Tax=Favolaschia claudopus TaxID=2862362 RepID=A0AAW0CQ42_9AGAR
MTSPRVVSVFGATGLQGGAVIDALIKDGTFVPRAISRDPDSEACKKLRARGIEVVKGDPAADKTGLIAALRGSEAVFGMTLPVWTGDASHPLLTEDEGGEAKQGKNMVDAAKEAGVNFFIFSSVPNLTKLSGGKYTACGHYDDKETIQEYLQASGLSNASLLMPAFLENYWKLKALTPTGTGGYQVSVPNYKADDLQAFAWVARDIPAAVLGLLKHYTDPTKQINGRAYPVVNARMSYAKLAEMTAQVLGKEVSYVAGPSTGLAPVDQMWLAAAEYSGLYTETLIPNPDLVALGVKLSTVEEFLQTEVKARYG